MKGVRWKAVLVLLLVFTSGAACAALLTRFVTRRAMVALFDRPPEEIRTQAILYRLDLKLGLSTKQQAALRAVLKKHQPALIALRRSIEPELKAIRDQQWMQIRAELEEHQRPTFDQMAKDLERRMSQALSAAQERTIVPKAVPATP